MLLSKSVVVPVACNEGYAWKHWNTVNLTTTKTVLESTRTLSFGGRGLEDRVDSVGYHNRREHRSM